MSRYPSTIDRLIKHFARLPGIGPKAAERLVFYLLRQPKEDLAGFGRAVEKIKDTITVCSKCLNFSETNPCDICRDVKRDKQIVCIVATAQDLFAIEKTSEFSGTYHILGGVINPIEGITPEQLNLKQLVSRVQTDKVKEIILALNSDMPGETTILYLTKMLKQLNNVKITRLAQGLPIGSDLQYADEITLTSALKGRKQV